MQFITTQFFIFFVAVFLVATLLKENKRYYSPFLLVVSAVFYLFFGINFFAILVLNIVLNYLLLIAVDKLGKAALVLSLVLNILFLAAFKYYNFGTDTLLQTLNLLNVPADIPVLRILIPVGISFYTFRNIAHLVDCYRKELPVPSFIDYANYIAFFPQIMSGPIVRAKEFYSYLHEPTSFKYSQGRIITLIISALIKKYVIASYLFNFVSGPFASPTNYSSLDLIIAAFAYSIMIFVDFSGYSDFAIAISNLLGFEVHPNFLSPYSAIGLKDFWGRWHISLSAWLKDYLYIPLGGSRKGKARKYLNILITMFVSGLWHGAGLTFVVWGLLHGIGSVISHVITDYFAGRKAKNTTGSFVENVELTDKSVMEAEATGQGTFNTTLNHSPGEIFENVNTQQFNNEIAELLENIDAPQSKVEVKEVNKDPNKDTANGSILLSVAKVFGWALTFIYVTFAWIFFTSSTISGALSFIGSIFVSTIAEHKIFNLRLVIVIAIVLLFNFIGNKSFQSCIRFFDALPLLVRIPSVAIVVYCIFQLGPETVPPFIYFNF